MQIVTFTSHLELSLILPNGLEYGVSHMAGGQHEVVGETEQPIRASVEIILTNQRPFFWSRDQY